MPRILIATLCDDVRWPAVLDKARLPFDTPAVLRKTFAACLIVFWLLPVPFHFPASEEDAEPPANQELVSSATLGLAEAFGLPSSRPEPPALSVSPQFAASSLGRVRVPATKHAELLDAPKKSFKAYKRNRVLLI